MKMKVTLVAIVDVGDDPEIKPKDATKLAKDAGSYTVQYDGTDQTLKKILSVEPAKGKDLTL